MKKKLLISLFVVGMCFTLVGCRNDKMNEQENISMTIKEGTLTKTSATIIITDLSGNKNTYGEWFRIDKKENDKWEELEEVEENNWVNLVALTVDENNKLELNKNWEHRYGKLESGEYRLVKEVNDQYISVEFKID